MNSSNALGSQAQCKPLGPFKLKSVQVSPSLYPPTSSLSRSHSRSAHLATSLSRPYVSCCIHDSANPLESPIDDIFGAFAPERYNNLPECSRPAAKALIAVALKDGVANAALLEQNRRKCGTSSKPDETVSPKKPSGSVSRFDPDPWFDDCGALVSNEALSYQNELDELNALRVKPDSKLCTPFSHLPFEALAPNNVLGENLAHSCNLFHEPETLNADAADASQRLSALAPHSRMPASLLSGAHRLNNSSSTLHKVSSPAIQPSIPSGNKTDETNGHNLNNNDVSAENSAADDVCPTSMVFDMDQSNSSCLNDTPGLSSKPLTPSLRQKSLVKLDVFLVHNDATGTVSIDWKEVLRDSADINSSREVKTEMKSEADYSEPSAIAQASSNAKDARSSLEAHAKNSLGLLPQKRSKPTAKSLEGSTSPDIIILDDSDTNQNETKGRRKRPVDGIKKEAGGSCRGELSGDSSRKQPVRSRKKRVSGSVVFQKEQFVSDSTRNHQRRQDTTSLSAAKAEQHLDGKTSDKVVRTVAKRPSRSDPQKLLRTPHQRPIESISPSSNGRIDGSREKRVSFQRSTFSDGIFVPIRQRASIGKRDRRLRSKSTRQIVESSDSDDQYRRDPDDDFEIKVEYDNLYPLSQTNQVRSEKLNTRVQNYSAEHRYTSLHQHQLDQPPVPLRPQADFQDKKPKSQHVVEVLKDIDSHHVLGSTDSPMRSTSHRISVLSESTVPKNELHKNLYDMLRSIVSSGDGLEFSHNNQGHDAHDVEEVENMLEAVGTGSPDLSGSEDVDQVIAKSIPIVRGVLRPCVDDAKTLNEVQEFDQTEEILQHYRDTRNDPPYAPNVNSFGTHYVTETMMSPQEAWKSGRIRSTLQGNCVVVKKPENGIALNIEQRIDEKDLPFPEIELNTTTANGARKMHTRSSLPSRTTRALRSQTKAEALLGEDGEEVEDYGDVDSACDDSYGGSSNRSESSGEDGYEQYGTLSKRARNQVKSRAIRAQELQHRVCGHYLKCMPDEMKKRVLMWADHDFSWFEPGKDFMELKVRENEIGCEQCDHDGVGEGTCEESILIKLWMDMSWRKVRRMKHRSRSA